MIRRHGALLRMLLAFADATAALGLIWLVSAFRFGTDWRESWGQIFNEPWTAALLVVGGWVIVLWSQGLYRLRRRWTFRAQVVAMVRALVVMVLATFAALFLLKLPDVSRLFVLLLLPAMAVVSLALRALIHAYVTALHREGRNVRFVLVVGSGPAAVRFTADLMAQVNLGLRVTGYLNGARAEPSMGVPYLGSYDDLGNILHSTVVDEVAVCLDLAEWELINNVAELCRAEGKAVRIPIAGWFLTADYAYIESLGGTPILSLLDTPERHVALAIKRVMDVVGASVGLILTAPLLLGVALYIRLKDGSPVIFDQTRVGLNGRHFRIYKFRSMIRDAEEQYLDVSHLSDTKGAAFKMENDPRITPWGNLLRRTSIDELPQLINVIKGDMSLVGPRPAPPREVDAYDVWHRRRLTMKPGITGSWQVSSRLDENFDDRARLDLDYIDRWSLWLDMKIVAMTIPAVLRSEGK